MVIEKKEKRKFLIMIINLIFALFVLFVGIGNVIVQNIDSGKIILQLIIFVGLTLFMIGQRYII